MIYLVYKTAKKMSEKEITPQENPDIQLSSCYYFEILKADNALKLSEQ
jgi:hypothetical protein